jgi:hypothetical protein
MTNPGTIWNKAFGITLFNIPITRTGKKNGSASLPVTLDFTAQTAINQRFQIGHSSVNQFNIADLQCVYIDNRNSGQPCVFLFLTSIGQQTIIAPAYSQGFYTLFFDGGALEFTATCTGGAVVLCNFLNIFVPPAVWNANSPATGAITVSGTVTALGAIAAKTDRGRTMTGANVSLMAANGARKSWIIRNPATAASQGIAAPEPLVINLTGAAALNAITGYELLPGESLSSQAMGIISTEAVNAIAATNGHIVQAWEFE